jgi:hypothetical protein
MNSDLGPGVPGFPLRFPEGACSPNAAIGLASGGDAHSAMDLVGWRLGDPIAGGAGATLN